jgi:hypothetical protein
MATARLWIIRLPLILLFKLFRGGQYGHLVRHGPQQLYHPHRGRLLFRRVSFTPMDAVQAAAEPTS